MSAEKIPAWLDQSEYPFQSRWFNTPRGRMHYIDEGTGRVVLFVHGNPSWSFEYRRQFKSLSRAYRCIAIDHIGFGLSDKPRDVSYLPQFHAENLSRFIEALGLDDITLVLHDWGGPIAMSYAVDHSSGIRGIVAFNSWFWPVKDQKILRRFSAIVGSPLGRFLCRSFNLFPRVLMRASFGDKRRLSPRLHRQFLGPFPTSESRQGTWVFPRAIVGESDWLESLWAKRGNLADVPLLLLWGLKDEAFNATLLRRWMDAFSNHTVVTFDDVGHNVPEESGERSVPPMETFLAMRR